jgi:hypothetical protein
LKPRYAKGYFGSRVVNIGPDTSELGLFDAIIDGTLDLDEATLRLRLENGFGADIQIALQDVTAMNTRTGAVVDLQHAILPGPINLNRALDQGNAPSASVYQNTLNNGNSNIDQFLENLPDRLAYRMQLRLNPLGDISNGNDFLYAQSELKASMELEVPLRIMASGLTLETYSTPELPGTAAGHALNDGTLTLYATNGFPLSAGLQLAIVDAEGTVLSEIPVSGSVPSAPLGPGGIVSSPSTGTLSVHLSAEQVDLLYANTRLRSRVVFSTSSATQHLRLLDRYAFDLQITAAFNYLVNGNE